MRTKLDELRLYSDPEIVAQKAQQLGLNPVHESSRKDKKYMVFNNERMVHFGSSQYEDFTKHNNLDRLSRFRKRNWRWQFGSRYSPAWLSWNLLWTETT